MDAHPQEFAIDAPTAAWVTIADLHENPFPIYQRLRAEGGVHWVPAVGRYFVTSYAAVHATELDQETFSANEQGSLMIRAMGHSMLRRDDPEHYVERKAWEPVLRPGVVKRTWTAMFRRNAQRYLAEFAEKGPGADLVWDFAAPYVSENLREIIGFHNCTQQDLQRWSQTMIDATGNYADDEEVWAKGKASYDEVDAALDEMLAWHSTHQDASLISALVRLPDYQMPLDAIRANVKMTIGGGLNEPRDALGVAAWALLTHPEQRQRVEQDPKLWPTVFEEAIRWVAPIGMYSRQTTKETILAGVRLPAGAKLGICLLAANRDEQIWNDAESFDVLREAKPHLAFGKGVHVCLGAWVAKAEVAAVGLPLLLDSLRGLRLDPAAPPKVAGWVFRGVTSLPVRWDSAQLSPAEPTSEPGSAAAAARTSAPNVDAPGQGRLSVAIVGSGPSGCYSAQALRRRFPDAHIDVFEELPVPYGLVRFGVAADHQGTKAVSRQFARLFERERVGFLGNTRLGTHVSLEQLRAAFDVVVLATGLHGDARLPLPGAELPGVHGAGRITRLLNSHPAEQEQSAPSLGRELVIVGHGNVAMDLARLLAKSGSQLDGSDIDDVAHRRLASELEVIHLVGRSQPAHAKFDAVMARELLELDGVEHLVHGVDRQELAVADDPRSRVVAELLDASDASTDEGGVARLRIHWRFGVSPEAFAASDDGGLEVTLRGDRSSSLRATSVVTAVGFVDGAEERVAVTDAARETGAAGDGVYLAGWLRRGPRGAIPDQRTDSIELAERIAADLAAGRVTAGKPGRGALPDAALRDATDFAAWQRIDAHETATAVSGRTRSKLRSLEELLRFAGADAESSAIGPAAPAAATLATQSPDAVPPLVILYGTESGNAELVAVDLADALGEHHEVEVRDLADSDPAQLEIGALHLLVCSTYGDGELPGSARAFHAGLADERLQLAGLRYAVFGLGDRSYTTTYSRGSELLHEALAACGATRVGEYGRHDAGSLRDPGEQAREWAEGVLLEELAAVPLLAASAPAR